MPKCKHDIKIQDIASLKKYLIEIGNDYFDQHAEDGLEAYIKFKISELYLYSQINGEFPNISIKEYDGEIAFIEECKKYIEECKKYNDKYAEEFKLGCEYLYKYYKKKKYICEGYNTNFQVHTELSIVSIVYLIARIFCFTWIYDAKLNQNKYYVPITFALSALLFSVACALILHTAGIFTIPFLKDVNLPTNANIITFLPIHFTIAIVFSIIATSFLGLGVHKLNNTKTVESTIEVVFNKVKNNRIDNLCTDCNNSKFYRRLIPISAAIAVLLTFVAFVLEVQANLQSSNPDLLGMGYLNKVSFPLHIGTFLCIITAISLSVLSIYKYCNKEDKKIIQDSSRSMREEVASNDQQETKRIVVDNEDQQHDKTYHNALGQNIARYLILYELPQAFIKSVEKA